MKWQVELYFGRLDNPQHEVVEVEAQDMLTAIKLVEEGGFDQKLIVAVETID